MGIYINDNSNQNTKGCGVVVFTVVLFLLSLVFSILKVTGAIVWSWWLIASPILTALVLLLIIIVIPLIAIIKEMLQ